MFFVGGGIVVHQLPAVHDLIHQGLTRLGIDTHARPSASVQLALKSADALFGLLLGLVIVGIAGVGRRIGGGRRGATA